MEDIIKKIEKLIMSPGFFYSYLVLIRINLFLPEGKILKINHYENLCFQELSFITGLLLKHGIDTTFVPNEEQMKQYLDEIYKYLFELHGAILGENPYSEPVFYGDSGAFDFQYANFTKLIYREDNERLGKNKNISFENALDFWKRKSEFVYSRINSKHKKSGLVELAKDTLENLLFQTKDIPEEFLPYFINFSCPSTGCNANYFHPMDFNQLEATPFILVNEGYFLPISFLLSKALYTTPFYRLLNDSKYYDSIASYNRGKANENICLSLTQDIVGKNNSYKNVMIKNEKGNDVTEIDTLLIIGNRAIIFQAKSKKLTEIAKKGDMEKLGQDFKAAVQDPYEQGMKCREAIINNKHSLWVDGKRINLHESIVDAYIVCVTLDYYPSVIFQSKMFLEHKEGNPRPICISVFDLEIICHYLKNKFELLFYLHQRANYGERIMAESEIAFLGFHLNQKLWFEDEYTLINILNDFGSLIDVHFPVDKGWHNKTPEYEKLYSKWLNPKFNNIVQKLIETNESGYTDAILFLYSIGGDSIDNLIDAIDKIKNKTHNDGKPHDVTMIFGNKGITIKTFPKGYGNITKELLNHAMARKYKSKADIWIGLGFYCDSKYDIDAACFGNFPREYDEELQQMSDKYLNRIPHVVNEKLERVKIGRNDPCPCGSGKKYKKCCLSL